MKKNYDCYGKEREEKTKLPIYFAIPQSEIILSFWFFLFTVSYFIYCCVCIYLDKSDLVFSTIMLFILFMFMHAHSLFLWSKTFAKQFSKGDSEGIKLLFASIFYETSLNGTNYKQIFEKSV